ncbi:MAG: DUF3109 family protein [Saprospiraceae bacterium]|nr:DUF3109 family protein [Saprospiraceae bacterium]
MIFVQEILVSEEVLERKFACKLSACKGACCWEGDWGAPLNEEEQGNLEEHIQDLSPYLNEESIKTIEQQGTSVYYSVPKMTGTPLLSQGHCAYLVKLESGIARCAIEIAYEDGTIPFRKPISCHLYPIRIHEDARVGLTALNYDEWDICQSACQHGSELGISVIAFLKDALVRRFGQSFYEELLQISDDHRRE